MSQVFISGVAEDEDAALAISSEQFWGHHT